MLKAVNMKNAKKDKSDLSTRQRIRDIVIQYITVGIDSCLFDTYGIGIGIESSDTLLLKK